MNVSSFIARRYAVSRKGSFSSFIIRLAMLATAISVATMILAVAFVSGFKYTIREKLFSFWGHVHVSMSTANAGNLVSGEPVRWDSAMVRQIRQTPHVAQVSPYALRPAIMRANGLMEGIKLKGVPATYKLSPNITLQGSYLRFDDSSYSKDIILSQRTADRLQLKAGDDLQLFFLEPGTTVPRVRKVHVRGLYHTGMDEIDAQFAICDLRLLQRLNGWAPNEINGYQIDLSEERYSDSVANFVFQQYVPPPLTTYTMREIYINIFDWLQLQDVNGWVILIIMAVVAVINLAVALLMLIVEQARMVGILKALGMPGGDIRKVFLYHAAAIAGMGILIGNALALALYWLQQRTGFLTLSEDSYYMRVVPVRIHAWQLLAIDAATLVLCILCMWLPTLYIRRIQPARVLQFK